MGLFGKKEPAYPFSGFSGQLFYEGKPAAYAKVTRSYELLDEKYEETIEADGEGRFSLESIVVDYTPPLLAAFEFLSHQDIVVSYKNIEYVIWSGSKTSTQEYAEFEGNEQIKVSCELTDEVSVYEKKYASIVTNCHL